MKGKILGFDAAGGSGAITGEDGQRYSFTAADWKSGGAPTGGAGVDFVTDGSAAKDIYPVVAGSRAASGNAGTPGPDLSEGLNNLKNALSNAAEGDMAKKALTVAHQRPQVILAIIILLASVFLTWSHVVPMLRIGATTADASLISYPSQASVLKTVAADALEEANSSLASFARQPSYDQSVNQSAIAEAQSQQSDFGSALTLLKVAYLAWLIPAGAAFLLYREFTNTRNRTIELAVGGVALGFAILCYYCLSLLISGMASNAFAPAVTILKEQISLGYGCWIIVAAGIGLILTGLGIVRETPGLAKLAAGQS